jgi:cobalt-zinc-cadmium efflux system membrane fusion protein
MNGAMIRPTASRRGGPRLLAVLLGLAMAAGCSRQAAVADGPPEPKVDGERVTFEPNAPQLSSLLSEAARPRTLAITHLTGRLYWNDTTTVRVFTPVAGQVVAIRADIGQPVQAGSPLAEISSPDYGQALADARTAGANLAASDRAFTRTKDLFEHGAAAAKDVEAAEAAFVAARAESDRAGSRLKLYGGMTSETGQAYVLRSPVPGVVVDRNINPGQEVRNDQMLANAPNLFAPLFVVSDPSVLWLQLDASEADIPSLQSGQKLLVHARAFPDLVFEGAVDRIGESMDPATRAVQVRGIVRNPDKLLKAEMYVLADVVRDDSKVVQAGVEISSKAIFIVDNQNYLFVERGPGQYERRKVSVGVEKDGKVPVIDGVTAGQRVVTEGALLLGSIVDPVN